MAIPFGPTPSGGNIADPAVPNQGDRAVAPTAQNITAISNAIFGAVDSAQKQYWQFRAAQQAAKNQPFWYNPNQFGQGIGGLTGYMPLILGAAAVGGIIWYVTKSRGGGYRRRR